MINILDISLDALTDQLSQHNIKAFVANQIANWVYKKKEFDIDKWLNISLKNRALLKTTYHIECPSILRTEIDSAGTRKILFELADGERIESVIIKETGHFTLCISSQAGCALGCKFCATGGLGFTRNLTSGEILVQILLLLDNIQYDQGKINLVFMGMGEPLLNYQNLKQALEIIISDQGINISPRNITVSTAGILKYIKALESDFPKIKLSFSLNGSSQVQRKSIMPIGERETLSPILTYFRTSKRKYRITFEYVLIADINDKEADAIQLIKLLSGIECKINLIPYNEIKGVSYHTPSNDSVNRFSDILIARGYTVMVRWSKGKEIRSACGQLTAELSDK